MSNSNEDDLISLQNRLIQNLGKYLQCVIQNDFTWYVNKLFKNHNGHVLI